MEYTCQHCGSNLDEGDIFEHFLLEYGGDHIKAKKTAIFYGWTETNHKHFDRSIILQPNIGLQYTICPDCCKKNPLQKNINRHFNCPKV